MSEPTSDPTATVHETSTIHGIGDQPVGRGLLQRARIWLAALLLAGLVFASSQTRDSLSQEVGSWNVTVEYAEVVRAGQPAPLEITVQSQQPIVRPIVVRLCATWFDAMDFQNWFPNPSAETRSSDTLEYEFDPPDSETLRIALDARAAPGQFGAVLPCDLSISSQEEGLFETSIRTWRMP